MAWGDEGGEPFECQILGGCAVVEIEIPWNLFVEWNDSGRGGEGGWNVLSTIEILND